MFDEKVSTLSNYPSLCSSQILMEPGGQSDSLLDEVVLRLRAKRGNDVIHSGSLPNTVVWLVLCCSVNIPLYKTTLTDPVEAIVELLCKIISDKPVADLERRVQRGDADAALELYIPYHFGLRGLRYDQNKSSIIMQTALSGGSIMVKSIALANIRVALSDDSKAVEQRFVPVDPRDEGIKAHDKRNQMCHSVWYLVDHLCAADYTSPIVLLMAGQAAANNKLFKDKETYTDNIRKYIERHPDAVT